MKGRKLIHDSFYVNSESFSGVTINELDVNLYYKYNKNGYNWELSILDESGNTIQTTGVTTPMITDKALKLTFNSISNADILVGDSSDVDDWNTFFDLPTYGTVFTSVIVTGNIVKLYGGGNIIVKDSLFISNTSLISIIDEVGVIVEVEDLVFASCSILDIVSLPALVTAGDSCFSITGKGATPVITSFNLPTLVTAGDSCFASCASLELLELPVIVTAGESCFASCDSLISLELPNLETAGDSCFYSCDLLESLELPVLATAGENCFASCASLISLELPVIVTAGYRCFYSCDLLESLELPVLATAGENCFASCASLELLELPVLVTAGDNCFYSCDLLPSLELPNLETAGIGCFRNNFVLTTISLPSCTDLGGTTGDNSVFDGIIGNIITLTIPTALNTDGDVTWLEANNTVTIVNV